MSRTILPNLTGRTIRCILFDLGTTLWTEKEYYDFPEQQRVVQQQVLTTLHQHLSPQQFPHTDEMTLGENVVHTINQHIHELYLLDVKHEPDFATGVVEALESLGFPRVDRTIGAEVFEAMRIRSTDSRELFPDALATLEVLKQRKFLLGVVTNREYGGPLFVEDMRAIGLLEYFDEPSIAVSADLNVRKPGPEIFQYALNALSVPAEETLMVGDSLGSDVVGAKELGMATAWKPSPDVVAQAREAATHQHDISTFNDMLFAIARQHEQWRGRPIPEHLAPDLIIENLSELLDVFVEPGKQ